MRKAVPGTIMIDGTRFGAGRGRTGRRTEDVAGKRDGVRAAPAGMNGKHRNG